MAGAIGIPREDITLGLIAGGRATRLGGLDKAWLLRGGVPQVLRLQARFAPEVAKTLVSANRDPQRYAAAGLEVVADTVIDAGPLAALDALAGACTTPWLFTLPVDVVDVNDCVLRTLVATAGTSGTWARDDDGPQPLVALWHAATLREAAKNALTSGDLAIQALQSRLGMRGARFDGVRFGNLNTPADLAAAGIAVE